MAVSPALDRGPEVTPHGPGAAPDHETRGDVPPPVSPRSAPFRLVLLAVLVAALVATLVWIPVLLAHRQVSVFGHEVGTDDAAAVQADREAAMAATQQFVMRVNTYGPSDLDAQGQMPAYRASVKSLIGFDRREELTHIGVPAICIAGEKDRLAPPRSMERMASAIPGGEFAMIEGAGHLLYLERPKEFRELLVPFLDEAWSRSMPSG